jgi:hypothetical protein
MALNHRCFGFEIAQRFWEKAQQAGASHQGLQTGSLVKPEEPSDQA